MQKGFTLIELIITIGLLAVIGTVIATNMTGTLSKRQEEQYEEFKTTLNNAACTYIDLNNQSELKQTCLSNKSCSVALQNLLTSGLVKESDLVDPRDGSMASGSVLITYDYRGIKTCEYKDN